MPDGNRLAAYIEGGEVRYGGRGAEARNLILWAEDHVCFTTQARAVMALADARHFQAKQRRERILEFRFLDGGCKIGTLPALSESEPYSVAFAFSTYCEFLRSIGITFTKRQGWGTVGRNIAKATGLPNFNGPPIARLAFYGGRKQAPYPASYYQTSHYDITAAYMHALGAFPIPAELKECGSGEWKVPDLDGIAFATVIVPSDIGEWAPLPLRADKRMVRHLTFKTGLLEGAWPFSELRMAAEYGCTIDIQRAYGGQRNSDYFREWYSLMDTGRNLPNGASAFAKHHANLLWSSYGTSPSGIIWKQYRDEYGHRPIVVKRQSAGRDFAGRTVYLSAIVASRIRERLYREILNPDGNPNLSVLHCDTDGVIHSSTEVTQPTALTKSTTAKPGEWRQTKTLPLVEIRSANAYRYLCDSCGNAHPRWHYICAGAETPELAKRLFERTPKSFETTNIAEESPETLPDKLVEYRPKRKRIRRYAIVTSGD